MNNIIQNNPDLNKLLEDWYSLSIKNWYLYIENIYILNSSGQVTKTFIASPLELSWEKTIKPTNHVVYIWEIPYQIKENNISKHNDIGLSSNQVVDGINMHQLSRKPQNGYENYHQKMTSYINILFESVKHLIEISAMKSFLNTKMNPWNSPLKHIDSNSSRSNISHLNNIFENYKIAIVGIWGTGSYLLDLISRLPLAQIDLFDDDIYSNHNFFRSPWNRVPNWNETKSTVFAGLYWERHSAIFAKSIKISSLNLYLLDNYNFVFICIDSRKDRKIISDYLNLKWINYLDTWIGLELNNNKLLGIIKISNKLHLPDFVIQENEDDVYKSNIQIAEINSLAASIAVIEWKKRLWYYHDNFSLINQPKEIITYDIT